MQPDLSWSLDPVALAIVVAMLVAYSSRWRAVRAQTGEQAAPRWRAACFIGAQVAILAALMSPIDSLSDQLFFVHMIQHVLLLDVAPILGILGLTRVLLRPLTRSVTGVERAVGPLAHPVFAVLFYIAVIWLWHIPAAYDLALRHTAIHVAEHLTFLLAGGLYWWHLLAPIRGRARLGGMGPVAYMVSSKLTVGALGMGLAFAPRALYSYYEHIARVWSISPHLDQEVAGLVMALEQSIVMGSVLAWLFVRMLVESEREQQRRERLEASGT